MGLFNHFPYPDTHQLNLDWILDAVKGCVDKVAELWTYVREPGAGIQKALTDAQAAANTAKTSATSAQSYANSANTSENSARTGAASAEAAATQAQTAANTATTSATSAQTAANTATTSATSAQSYANSAQDAAKNAQAAATRAQELAFMLGTASAKLYPVGAVYVNYRNQEMPVESDATVIERLQYLTGGRWERAGSHGQPVTEPGKLGWTIGTLSNADGDANDFNFNIYVRTK